MQFSSIPAVAHRRIIAIDIDDTLNNFTEVLRNGDFPYEPDCGLTEETYQRYLTSIREGEGEPGELLSTGYSFCRFKIHMQCWQRAKARPDGVEFVRWLRREGWQIVICTRRDLRRASECTTAWLHHNAISFDYLFWAANKIAFCRAWGIRHLVDDSPFSILHGADYGIDVYYPLMPIHQALPAHGARAFQSFAQIQPWIQE